MKKLSYIIPAYNVAPYIDRCLNSILSQNIDIDDYEIIIVDDGSIDTTWQKLEKYRSIKNCKCFHQINSGVSAARNLGLTYAEGMYIWFIDADDFIEPDCSQKLIDYAMRMNSDIVIFNYNSVSLDSKFVGGGILPVKRTERTYDGKNLFIRKRLNAVVWNKIYKRTLLYDNELMFDKELGTLEDYDFHIRSLFYAQHVNFYSLPIYNYCEIPFSLSRNIERISKMPFLVFKCMEKHTALSTACSSASFWDYAFYADLRMLNIVVRKMPKEKLTNKYLEVIWSRLKANINIYRQKRVGLNLKINMIIFFVYNFPSTMYYIQKGINRIKRLCHVLV